MAAVNLLVFGVLFGLAELAYRAYTFGVGPTVRGLLSSSDAPYSDLGATNWVIYDEELGYRLNPAMEAFNDRSFQGGEVATPKPDGLFRLAYLGDSVPFDDPGFVSFSAELLDAAPEDAGRIEVINTSVPGYTSYQEVLFYERYVADLAPDLVVWTYCLNDNHRFLHRMDDSGSMLATAEAQASLTLDPPWSTIVGSSLLLQKVHTGLVGVFRPQADAEFEWERSADFNTAWEDHTWPAYEANLRRLLGLLEQNDARLAIVIFPFEPQLRHAEGLAAGSERLAYITKPQRTLTALCEKHALPCLDLFPTFLRASAEGPRLYRDGIHLSDDGHQLAAGEIVAFLASNDLVPAERHAPAATHPASIFTPTVATR